MTTKTKPMQKTPNLDKAKSMEEKFECMDCDYIGDKKALQDHVISSGTRHRMKPMSKVKGWEKLEKHWGIGE